MEENKNLNLSDLETLVYDYIVKQNAYYSNINIQVRATQTIINKLYAEEKKRIIKFFHETQETYIKKFPIAAYIKSYGSLFNILSEIEISVYTLTSALGRWKIYPLAGEGCPITYRDIMLKLGLSKYEAKKCTESLLEKGCIYRRKCFGGYEYSAQTKDIAKKMIENKGDFKPRTFDQNISFFKVDNSLYSIFNKAQPNYDSFQDYYERLVTEEAEKHMENKNEKD